MVPRPRGRAEANVAAHHVRPRGGPLCSTPRPGLGTAVVMDDHSPSPRSARDQPQCHRSAGGSVSMSQGVYVSQRGSFRWRSTRTEHRPFSCESAWTGSAPNIALFRRGRPYRHRMNIAHFIGRRLVVPDAPRCMDSKGRCLFGRLVADGGGCRRVLHPLPAAPRGQRGAVPWTRRGQPHVELGPSNARSRREFGSVVRRLEGARPAAAAA